MPKRPGPKPGTPSTPPPYTPTRAEIRAGCLEIQKRWTPAERERRLRHDWRPVEASTPLVTVADFGESIEV